MPFILGANSLTGGYTVDNSLRFDEASTTFLSKASFGTPTSTTKSTVSFWCKRSLVEEGIIFMNDSATFPIAKIYFDSSHRFSYVEFNPTIYVQKTTSALFRDLSAWSHFVVAVDTTQGSADNRIKIYHNGTQVTSFAQSTVPAQDSNVIINNNLRTGIGGTGVAGGDGFEGYIAELVRIDGQALAPTDFGEFDEDSGIWKPIDVSGLTFGDNGFYLETKDSGALGADTSGNGNNFTVNNLTAVDQSTDTPTNNFATFNPLFTPNPSNVSTFSEGNLKVVTNSTSQNSDGLSTLGVSSGKYYGEFKLIAQATGESVCGVLNNIENVTTEGLNGTGGFSVASNGDSFNNGSSQGANNFSASYTNNDIIGIALDLDNNRVYFSKNGSYTDGSGNFDESSPTGYFSLTSGQTYFMGVGDKSTSQSSTWEANFGSPSFAISSGNTDPNGYGNFEYAVPSGYYALNTKNLAEYG